jgi:NTP pyrophosphatase (non-canonical NTP hydrolase)
MFEELSNEIHRNAVDKGFWPEKVDDIFITKQLMMIVSEAVEVMEAIRKSQGKRAVADEMADIIIRTLDLHAGLLEHGYTDTSLAEAVMHKAAVNVKRPALHGVKF